MMRWLHSDASNRLQAVRTAEVIGAALEAQTAVLRWRLKQPCCYAARSSSQVTMLHESIGLVISCEEIIA